MLDFHAFSEFMTDPEVNYYMDNITLNREEVEELFEKIIQLYRKSPNKPFFVWSIESEGICIGHLELKETGHTVNNELEVVYLLNKKYWRKGIMRGLIKEIVRFADLQDKQVIATVDKGNLPSIELLRKIGVDREFALPDDDQVLKIVLQRNIDQSEI